MGGGNDVSYYKTRFVVFYFVHLLLLEFFVAE